jgi:hypothetical protein
MNNLKFIHMHNSIFVYNKKKKKVNKHVVAQSTPSWYPLHHWDIQYTPTLGSGDQLSLGQRRLEKSPVLQDSCQLVQDGRELADCMGLVSHSIPCPQGLQVDTCVWDIVEYAQRMAWYQERFVRGLVERTQVVQVDVQDIPHNAHSSVRIIERQIIEQKTLL